jgi:hypothetical protein
MKFVNLQMAAEAFLVDANDNPLSDTAYTDALKRGNDRNSKFTNSQAQIFANHWAVVAQKPNTPTGFIGTLFKCIQDDPATGAKAGELVLSFRSTEFLDDAARDNQATNAMEITESGWAFGQIRDMQAWFQQLAADPAMLQGKTFSVTGYSLGGHLATAFNILHPEVIAINGARAGEIRMDGNRITWPEKGRNLVGRKAIQNRVAYKIHLLVKMALTRIHTTIKIAGSLFAAKSGLTGVAV